MNIFYLHGTPKLAAEQHCDKHVVKMILEYAQLLSTAHRVCDGTLRDGYSKSGRRKKVWALADSRDPILYSATHVNHPSAIWVRQNQQNYIWLSQLLHHLCKEYTHRYGKVHKVEHSGLLEELYNWPMDIKQGTFFDPTPAMPEDCIIKDNVLESYHKYYRERKAGFAKWTKRPVPEWFTITN